MEEIYQIWLNYYRIEFLPIFQEMCDIRLKNNSVDFGEICIKYAELVEKSCTLIQRFLSYNGLFQFNNSDVLREAFYVEFIDDGETWFDALSLSKVIKTNLSDTIKTLIIRYLDDDKFCIFNKLNYKFQELVTEYA